MITVAILINGQPIYARSAVNVTEFLTPEELRKSKPNQYRLDDGTMINHKPNDGAVKLAIEMLKTIKDVK